jgi:hypothetical protein
MSQGQSDSRSNHSRRKMCRGGPNELGHLFGESFFDRLHRILGEMHRVSLCLPSYLIELFGWNPNPYQWMRVASRGNAVVRYANLWHTMKKRRQIDSNVMFYVYFDMIMYIVEHMSHITAQTVETYQEIV